MSFSGLDFYNRLSSICQENGTSISAFLSSIGRSQSAGTYMKKRPTADMSVATMAAQRFNVTVDWLCGISHNKQESSNFSTRPLSLTKEEENFILELRDIDPMKRAIIQNVIDAIIHTEIDSPFNFNDEQLRHSPNSAPPIVRKSFRHPRASELSDELCPTIDDIRAARKRVEGDVAAGVPMQVVPDTDDTAVVVPAKYLGENYTVVRAHGKSMVGDGIMDGDYCVFQRDAFPDDGRIVWVQCDSLTDQPDGTIKHVYRRGAKLELRSSNPSFKPMLYPADEVRVMGVLAHVIHANEAQNE